MKLAFAGFVLLLVLALAGAGGLFWVQNSSIEVVTSLELWVVGRYGSTWNLPSLMAVCAAVGTGFGLFAGWWLTASAKNRRINALVRQVEGSPGETSW